MTIKLELLKNHICDYIHSNLENLEIDVEKIADTVAIAMLQEIQSIVRDEANSDFDAMEKIVCVFEKNGIDFGSRHDF